MISAYKTSRLFYIRINVGIPLPSFSDRDLSNIEEQRTYVIVRACYRDEITHDINHASDDRFNVLPCILQRINLRNNFQFTSLEMNDIQNYFLTSK